MNYYPNKQAVTLALFALLVTSALALVNKLTLAPIAANETRQLHKQLSEVLPTGSFDNKPQQDQISLMSPLLGTATPQPIYRATKNNLPSAAIIQATAADGYAGKIELLVAVLFDGTLAGVRVLHHRETPGLGDDIDIKKSSWITSFDGASLRSPPLPKWLVKKDNGHFDQFTGATITPRAIVRAVKNTLIFFEQNRELIFSAGT